MSSTDLDPAHDFSAEFDARVSAIERSPGLSSTSATKYRPLEDWLASVLRVGREEIRTVWVDGSGAFTARRGTIASARPRLCVILVGVGLERIGERARELVAGTTECVALAPKE